MTLDSARCCFDLNHHYQFAFLSSQVQCVCAFCQAAVALCLALAVVYGQLETANWATVMKVEEEKPAVDVGEAEDVAGWAVGVAVGD